MNKSKIPEISDLEWEKILNAPEIDWDELIACLRYFRHLGGWTKEHIREYINKRYGKRQIIKLTNSELWELTQHLESILKKHNRLPKNLSSNKTTKKKSRKTTRKTTRWAKK